MNKVRLIFGIPPPLALSALVELRRRRVPRGPLLCENQYDKSLVSEAIYFSKRKVLLEAHYDF